MDEIVTFPSDPAFDRATEVNAVLEADPNLIGEIWRDLTSGMSAQEIAEAQSRDPAVIYAYIKLIKALQEGEVPSSPSTARGQLGRVRTWIKEKQLSPELRAALEQQRSELERVAEDPAVLEQQVQAATQLTNQAVRLGEPGIYVYTLPHYITHPFNSETGMTLFKVGHSSRDTMGRFVEQGRVTALPEDPVLLRIYPVEESAHAERQFHDWLRSAQHVSPSTRRGGKEWFVTSTVFLDRIAGSLGLEIRKINPDMDVL